jgi:tetratricopeptide (TPR) repeat protein
LSRESRRASALYYPVATVDVRSLPLGPEEAYVLSRVDGKSEPEAIGAATGIASDRVLSHLRRLEQLGAVRNATTRPAGETSLGSSSSKLGSGAIRGAAGAGSASDASPGASSTKPAADGRWASETDATLNIGVELQIRILDLASRLPELDHFQVLGVRFGADRVTIKRAYFAMIGTFHPDTYFGKQLGGFTKRMEKIFQRLTEAHDVLSNAQTRAEYEKYLGALGRTRALEEMAPPPSVEDLEQLLLQAEQAVKKPEPPPAISAARHALQPPPLPQRKTSLRPVELVDDPIARRQALARKFGLAADTSSAPPPAPEDNQEDHARHSAAVKDLLHRYQHRKGAIRDQRVERFAAAAEEALAAGNTVSALNTLKIARTLSGGDLTTVERLQDLEHQVGATVADSYLERARYEETNGHFEQAARSYTRAGRGRPDPDVLKSAAECYLKAGLELRLASDLAREAVQLAPNRTDLRLTLAKIYEAAGMQQSAVREVERALELTPDSDRIKQWLKRIKRGGV